MALRVATEAPACQMGSFCSQPWRPAPERHASYSSGFERRVPRCPRRRAARTGFAVRQEYVVGDEEVLRRKAENLLDLGDLVGAERAPVRGGRVLHLRRRVTDVRPEHEQRGSCLLGDAGAEPRLQRVEIVRGLTELHDMPAVRFEPLRDVVGVRELGRAVDRDVVVVVDEDHAPEAQVPGERRGFVADAFHQVAVAADPEDAVVAEIGAEALAQVLLVDRESDRVREALAEGAGRDLDTLGVAVLRVTGSARGPLAELADVVELEAVPGEVEHRVEEHRRVAGGEHEPVAVRPVGLGGVVLHDARPQHVREGGERHRRSGMPRVRLLHRVHRQTADHVDSALFQLVSHIGPFRHPLGSLGVPTPRPRVIAREGYLLEGGASALEHGNAGREAVQEVPASDRADLTGTERSRERYRTE